ncbi:mechanosensitive ion channel family protein [Novosphingobium sp. 9]|uniref:mechanosensitive ion channel family protein n=1 Tax=Novosphingobium sp. 9 TaxID=2025349 RepID=UPI0021B5AC22|nr:mechanosensitive ion channel domain-containing protein [Novosphingobium sp. 9]
MAVTSPAAVPAAAATGAPISQAAGPSVSGAEGLRDAVSAKSHAIGGVVDTLDSLAVQVGHSRVSVWDLAVVIFVVVMVIVVAWSASRVSQRLIERATRFDASQRLLAHKLVSLLIWSIAILVGVDAAGIDLTAFAVFSGAFGLAIGFGLQKTFGNLIAGIILLMDKSIKPGDVIGITDQGGKLTFGQIRRIGIRAVSLTTRDQKEYLIPNENLMINQVENWSYSSRNVRIQIPVVVSYTTDIQQAEDLMLEAARSVKRVLVTPPPTVWLDSFVDNGVSFVINCWITDPEEGVGNVRSDALKTLWRLFRENGIELPLPQRDINLRDTAIVREALARLGKGVGDTGEDAS